MVSLPPPPNFFFDFFQKNGGADVDSPLSGNYNVWGITVLGKWFSPISYLSLYQEPTSRSKI